MVWELKILGGREDDGLWRKLNDTVFGLFVCQVKYFQEVFDSFEGQGHEILNVIWLDRPELVPFRRIYVRIFWTVPLIFKLLL